MPAIQGEKCRRAFYKNLKLLDDLPAAGPIPGHATRREMPQAGLTSCLPRWYFTGEWPLSSPFPLIGSDQIERLLSIP
jgi:hypothetical protein